MDSGRTTVRNMRSKCRCSYVLQFTFRRAVCCVLHRPPSQVIHCTVLFLNKLKVGTVKARFAQSTVDISSRGGRAKKTQFRGEDSSNGSHRTANRAAVRGVYAREPSRSSRAPEQRRGRQQTSRQPWETDSRKASPPAREGSSCQRQSRRESIMILPQVHLRKPCYDFYFL